MSVPLYQSGAPLYEADAASTADLAAFNARQTQQSQPTKPVELGPSVNVTDGTHAYSVPKAQLAQAAADGFHEETAPERAVREYLKENEGLSGTGKVLLRSAVGQLGFGLGGAIWDGLDTDPLERAKYSALAKQHEAAAWGGAAAGFAADLLLTKGTGALKFVTRGGELARGAVLGERGAAALGEAVAANMLAEGATKAAAQSAGAGFARKLAANAAQMGTEGLLISAPKAVTEAALGDPQKAAETILAGVAGGALLGAGGGLLSSGVSAAGAAVEAGVGKLTGGKTLQEFASAKAQEFKESYGVKQFWLANKETQKLAAMPGGTSGALEVLERHKLTGLQPGESFAAVAERTAAAREKVGQEIDGIVTKYGSGVAVGRKKVGEKLRSEVLAELEQRAENDADIKPLVDRARTWIENYEAGGRQNVTALNTARKEIDKTIKWSPGMPDIDAKWNNVKIDIRSVLDDVVFDKLERVGLAAGKDINGQLRNLKRDYVVLATVDTGVQKNVGRELANRGTSLTDTIASTAGAAIGSAVGGLAGGLVGSAAGAAVNNFGRRYGPGLLVGGITQLQNRGILLTEQAMGAAARQLDRVPSIVERLAGSKVAESATRLRAAVAPIAETTPTRVFSEYLGHSNGTASDQAAEIAQKVAAVASDPGKLQANADAIAKNYADDAPNVAAALKQQSTAAVRYLQSALPPPPPFSPLNAKQKPAYSDAQIRAFARKLEAVHDPWTVLQRLENGTLTKEHIEALRTVYPSLYQDVVQRSIEHATRQSTLPYAAQLRLQQLTGAPLVPSVQRVSAFQSMYGDQGQKPRPSHGKPFTAPKPSTVARISG